MSRLPVAQRTWAEAAASATPNSRATSRGRRVPDFAIVIDAETTVDATQRLLLGSYRFLDLRGEERPVGTCLDEGLFYGDDLPERDSAAFAVVRQYAAEQTTDVDPPRRPRPLKLLSRREFVDGPFWKSAYKSGALVVGFNLPFDLSRLAVACSPARNRFKGGFSFVLWQYQDDDGNWHEIVIPLKHLYTHTFDPETVWELEVNTWQGDDRRFSIYIDDIAVDIRPPAAPAQP